jgi:uncharacterized SAM-binding protein YcdF (DUF218 family)
MATLKLWVGAWLLPLPISLVMVVGGVLLRFAGRRRAARILIIAGVLFGWAAAFGPLADALLRPLESRYHATLDAAALQSAPHYVVVLGSGYRPRDGLPVTAALDPIAVVRLTEGIRLLRQLPDAVLIVSGGSIRDEPPIARGYALAAKALGVPDATIILVDTPVDTSQEVRAIRERVGDGTVLLVTSAAHMPRAMLLAQLGGLRAIAAPTNYLVDPNRGADRLLTLPSGASLRKSEIAFHEYLGLLALRLGIT